VFPVPTPNVIPENITVGPDGNLWFNEGLSFEIGMINPTTGAITQFPVSTPAWKITAGPNGEIWFTNEFGDQIGVFNPTTDVNTEITVPLPGSAPDGITAGPDGNLWFTEPIANAIGMMNATTHAITEFPVPTANSGLNDITAGPDGNIWFTEERANQIGMINPTTGAITEFPIPPGNSWPASITSGPDGTLIFTASNANMNQIGLFNLTTGAITEFPISTNWPSPPVLTVGPDGNIWFGGDLNGGYVGKLNPTTGAVTEYPVPVANPGSSDNDGPYGITAGPDGNIWFALSSSDEIGVLNPYTITAAPAVPPPPVTPASPVVSTAKPEPGTPFGFALTLAGTTSPAETQLNSTVTLSLSDNPADTALTVATANGIHTYSGLTLKKFGDGYKLVYHSGTRTATPRGAAAVARARPIRIAAEKVLIAGKGKDMHVTGFEVELSKALDPIGSQDVARRSLPQSARRAREIGAQSVSLLVDYNSPAGGTRLILTGKATIASGGQIVVIAGS
jgi:streptogramin lyase